MNQMMPSGIFFCADMYSFHLSYSSSHYGYNRIECTNI